MTATVSPPETASNADPSADERRLEEYVSRQVASWPPLTDDECARLAALLGGGR